MDDLLLLKAAIIGVWFALLFIAERLARAAPPPASSARLIRNISLSLIILTLSPLIVGPITAYGANHLVWVRPVWMTTGFTFALVLILDIIMLDLWTYWVHRAYHRIPAMWRLHEVHHRDEFLDTTSAFRFHIGEIVLSAILRLLPIVLFAIPLITVLTFETILLCAAIFHHSNVKLPERMEQVLSVIIVTPSIHWVHHHAVLSDTNSNYAGIFSLWDRVFGSVSKTPRRINMKIGVEGVEDRPLLGLILMPLRRK